MRLVALPVLALVAMACNPPEAKDRQTLPITLELVKGGEAAIAIFAIEAGVDAQARDMETTIEVGLSTLYEEGVAQDIELALLDGILNEVATARWSDGTVSATITPGFASCDGESFTIRDDGGCDYLFSAWFAGDAAYGGIASFDLRTQASDEWEGDPDSIEVYIDAELARAE